MFSILSNVIRDQVECLQEIHRQIREAKDEVTRASQVIQEMSGFEDQILQLRSIGQRIDDRSDQTKQMTDGLSRIVEDYMTVEKRIEDNGEGNRIIYRKGALKEFDLSGLSDIYYKIVGG